MEETGQNISLCDRKMGRITGVVEVISFDPESVLLVTTQGSLTLRGKELHVSRLCLEEGEIAVSGRVDSLQYSEKTVKKKRLKKRLSG